MTWQEARQYCQKNYIDMLTMKNANADWLAEWMLKYNIQKIWLGLLRDPEQDSVWKWIDRK